MISPAMRSIRRTFPQAEITLLAKTWVLEALGGSPFYDRLVEYDREGSHSSWSGRWSLIRHLRRENFDLALLFQKAFEAAFFAYLAGVPRRVGFRTDARGWLLTDPVEPPTAVHHADQFFCIAESVGASGFDRRLSFHVTPQGVDAALGLVHKFGLRQKLLIAIHPGASKTERAWHAERMGQVVEVLMREYEAVPILLGTACDRPALDTIQRIAGPQCILLGDALRLQEMAALLQHCRLLICNDSGPMHIAAALRVPVVAVFGPGSGQRTGPFSDPDLFRITSHDFACSPCRQKYFKECLPTPSGKPFCLDEVTVDEVLDDCREMLKLAIRPDS